MTLDLGGRVLEVTGSPGHQRAAITIYDPWSGFLLTGDTVLPGRLYVEDFPLFLASLDGMVKLAGSRTVTHVLGCHVEMTSQPGRDYPIGATYQPGERAPEMTTSQLTAVRDAAASVAGHRGVHTFNNFIIIYNEPRRRDLYKLVATRSGVPDPNLSLTKLVPGQLRWPGRPDPRLRKSGNPVRSASVWLGPSASAGPPMRYSAPTPDGPADGGEFRVGDAMIWKLLTTFRAGLVRASVMTPRLGVMTPR